MNGVGTCLVKQLVEQSYFQADVYQLEWWKNKFSSKEQGLLKKSQETRRDRYTYMQLWDVDIELWCYLIGIISL